MELDPWFYEAGLIGLFAGTLLSATIVPLASEALVLWFLSQGFNSYVVLIVASLGNGLGGMITYGMGRLLPFERSLGLLRADERKVRTWMERLEGRGPMFALLCWLSIIGDMIALALGVLKARWIPMMSFMFLGKALRYAVLIAMWGYLFG